MGSLIGLLEFAAGCRARLRLAAFDDAGVDWAIATGLGPLLYEAVRSDPGAARSPHWPRLAGAQLAARVVTDELFDAAGEILDACAARGHRVTLLKGVSVAARHYPEPHVRLMRDLDLLVTPDAAAAADALLRDLGYRPRSAKPAAFYATHHHGVPLFHPQRAVWVELHRALFPPQSALGADPVFGAANVEREIRPAEFRGRRATRLSDELQLVYLAAHWGRRFNPRGGLFPLLDAIYLLRGAGSGLDWDRILGWLAGSAAAPHVYLLLSYLARHRLVELAPEVQRALRRSQRCLGPANLRLAHALIRRYMLDGRPFGRILTPGTVQRLWRTLLAPRSAAGNLARIPGVVLAPRRWRAAWAGLGRSG